MVPLLYMIRHGQTDWNAEGRLQGQADTDINARGRAQADRAGARLAEVIDDPAAFDFVASPLGRTRETMERVRAAMRLPPGDYRTDPLLMELHFGDWQGLTYGELEAREPGSTEPRSRDKWGFVSPGADAESYAMLTLRVEKWLAALDRPTVCVTHGGVMRAALVLVGKMPPSKAVDLHISQDRILRLEDSGVEWL